MTQSAIDKRHPQNTRQALWALMMAKGENFCAGELAREAIYHKTTVKQYLESLLAAGILVRVDINGTHCYSFAPGKRIPAVPPRVRKDGSAVTQGQGRKNLWRTAKIMGEFTVHELTVFARTPEVKIKESEAADYVKHLQQAGYLVVVAPAKAGQQRARYRFVMSRYTGPEAPKVQRVNQVFDPNLGAVVWTEGQKGVTHAE